MQIMQQIVDGLTADDRNKLQAMPRIDQQRWFDQMMQRHMQINDRSVKKGQEKEQFIK